jgi:hypothetical protein
VWTPIVKNPFHLNTGLTALTGRCCRPDGDSNDYFDF